jgi:hypothetical protein
LQITVMSSCTLFCPVLMKTSYDYDYRGCGVARSSRCITYSGHMVLPLALITHFTIFLLACLFVFFHHNPPPPSHHHHHRHVTIHNVQEYLLSRPRLHPINVHSTVTNNELVAVEDADSRSDQRPRRRHCTLMSVSSRVAGSFPSCTPTKPSMMTALW